MVFPKAQPLAPAEMSDLGPKNWNCWATCTTTSPTGDIGTEKYQAANTGDYAIHLDFMNAGSLSFY